MTISAEAFVFPSFKAALSRSFCFANARSDIAEVGLSRQFCNAAGGLWLDKIYTIANRTHVIRTRCVSIPLRSALARRPVDGATCANSEVTETIQRTYESAVASTATIGDNGLCGTRTQSARGELPMYRHRVCRATTALYSPETYVLISAIEAYLFTSAREYERHADSENVDLRAIYTYRCCSTV